MALFLIPPSIVACKSKSTSKIDLKTKDGQLISATTDGHWFFSNQPDDSGNELLAECAVASSNEIPNVGKVVLDIMKVHDDFDGDTAITLIIIPNIASLDRNKLVRLKHDNALPYSLEYETSDDDPDSYNVLLSNAGLENHRALGLDLGPASFADTSTLTIELPLQGISEREARVSFDFHSFKETCKFK